MIIDWIKCWRNKEIMMKILQILEIKGNISKWLKGKKESLVKKDVNCCDFTKKREVYTSLR